MGDEYEVISNRESGLGRYDIMIVPRVTTKPGIVIEFKTAQANESLDDAAKRAIDQIKDKKYAQDLQKKGLSDILIYGIAFKGKHLKVLTEQL